VEALRTLDAGHILRPDSLGLALRLAYAPAHLNKLTLFFRCRLALGQIQLVESVTITLKKLSFFDGEITVA